MKIYFNFFFNVWNGFPAWWVPKGCEWKMRGVGTFPIDMLELGEPLISEDISANPEQLRLPWLATGRRLLESCYSTSSHSSVSSKSQPASQAVKVILLAKIEAWCGWLTLIPSPTSRTLNITSSTWRWWSPSKVSSSLAAAQPYSAL